MFIQTCGPSVWGGGPSGQFSARAEVALNAAAAPEIPAAFRKVLRFCCMISLIFVCDAGCVAASLADPESRKSGDDPSLLHCETLLDLRQAHCGRRGRGK